MKVAFVAPASPSVTVTSLIESVGSGSSSVIVPRPLSSVIVAAVAFDSSSVKVSSPSSSWSPLTTTVTDLVVSPAANVSVPLVAPKSAGEVALPGAVAKSTVTCRPLTGERVTVKVALVVPVWPSVTVTSSTDSAGSASSSVIVPRPVASAMRRVAGVGEVEGEGLVDLVEGVAADGDGDGLGGLARGEAEVAGDRGVVAPAIASASAVA